MKNILSPVIVFTFIIVFFPPAAGCKVDSLDLFIPAEPSTLISIEVSPSTPSMAPGSTLQLEAIGKFSNNTTRQLTGDVTWNSQVPGMAAVSNTGLVTSTPASSGTAIITAVSGSITGSTVITFSPLASITVDPENATMAPGTSRQFSAVGILENSASQDLTGLVVWNSSDAVATVTEDGLVTADETSTGQTAVSASFGGITGSTTLTSSEVVSIAVHPANSTLSVGGQQQFTAIGTFPNNEKQTLTQFAAWSTLSSGIVSIDSSGIAISISPGIAVITAAFRTVTGSGVLTVSEPSLISISVTPASQSIAVGTSQQFAATGTYTDGSKKDITSDVTWISSNPAIAPVSNAEGTKGNVSGSAEGTVTISATLSGIQSNQTSVRVTAAPDAPAGAARILINPSNPVVTAGNSLQLTAVAVSSDGSFLQDMTAEATWTSSNSSVAFVSQGFAVSLAPGSATITATAGNLSGSTLLTVTNF